MGRARKRERAARLGQPPGGGALRTGPAAPAPAAGAPDGQGPARPLDDPDWRRAERRRIARLNRLPDPFRTWGDRSRAHGMAVAALQMLLAIALTLPLLRLTTGQWLPPYAAVVALGVAVVLQGVCRSVNRRADERAARA